MLRPRPPFSIVFLFALASAASPLACSGDHNAGPPPPAEGGAPTDAADDATTLHDASPSVDASPLDAGAGDASAPDASPDAPAFQDSSQDGLTDASDSGATDSGITAASWMAAIPGATSLAALSIPGTHDTGATLDAPGTAGTTKCQDLSVDDQLAIGVRYMDIRLKAVTNDQFEVFHTNVDQSLTFDQVLASIFTFLTENPGEAVVMSVKQEQGPAPGVTSTFEQTFDAYVAQHPERWYLGDTIPTLDPVRGKIVLLRRFGATTLPTGIDASSGWADNTTFTLANGSATLRIQDYYQVTDLASKWAAITSLLAEATQLGADAGGAGDAGVVLYLNNTSAYFELDSGLEDIPDVSNAINPELVTYFTSNTSGRYGIVGMDFVDATKASLVLSTNFH